MTKEQLELKVKELNAALTQFETDQAALKVQLDKAKSDLKDVSKPLITKETSEEICRMVYDAVNSYDFSNIDNYEYEFEIDYNNRIVLSSLEFNYTDDLQEVILDYVESVFKVEDND